MKHKKMCNIYLKTILYCMAILVPIIYFKNIAEASSSDFYIEDGILLGYSGTKKDITIPKSVKEIGEEAFYNKNIESVVIPDSVKKIGKRAFCLCSELRSVTLSKSITTIPTGAFMSCTSLTSITIPKNITSIENDAFWNCSKLKQINILNENVYIGSEVFVNTTWLDNSKGDFIIINSNLVKYKGDDPIIEIPNNVRVVCGMAFDKLEGLEKVTLPNSVEIIGENAFYMCEELRKVKMPSSVTAINDYAFNQCYSLKNIKLSDNLESIGKAAFYDSGLVSITIPESVKSIKDNAFSSCDNLIDVILPESITNFATNAFKWTPWVKKVIDESINDFVIINNKLFGYKGKSSSVTIPDGVTAIMADAFKESSLKEVVLPDSVVEIGYCAFNSCKKLKNINLSKNIKKIEMYAFDECTSLEEITLPDSLIFIDGGSFRSCSNLKYVSIPKNVNITYYNNPFECCQKLTTVKCNGNDITYSYMKTFIEKNKIKCNVIK